MAAGTASEAAGRALGYLEVPQEAAGRALGGKGGSNNNDCGGKKVNWEKKFPNC